MTDTALFSRPAHLPGVELVNARYRGREFPTHSHDGFVIGVIVTGAESLRIGQGTHLASAGDLLHLHPQEPHANACVGEAVLAYRVFYLPEETLRHYAAGGRVPTFSTPVTRDPAGNQQLDGIHRALSNSATCRLSQESAMQALAGILTAKPSDMPVRRSGVPQAVREAQAFIAEHYHQDFGLTELASVAGLSVFRLAHLFKSATGLSPIAYRNQCRVDAARRRLRTKQPIADIAAELGFADQSHLTRQFQRLVGISPNRYRQQ